MYVRDLEVARMPENWYLSNNDGDFEFSNH
jgi:hypothetical protein